MNRRVTRRRLLFPAVPAAACAAGLLLLALSGCFTPQVLRPQAAEETERDRYGVKSLGTLFQVGSIEPKPVGGIGLVTGLDGTGGDSPHDENRTTLEKYLRQKGCNNVNQILNSGETALVIVSGKIPIGAHADDHFDVEVTLPHGSKATSLRGGVLEDCILSTYEYGRSAMDGAVGTIKGHPIARAKGPLQLSLGQADGNEDAERLTHANVWMGGQTRVDNPLTLFLNEGQQFVRISNMVATRINEALPGALNDSSKQLAVPANKVAVTLNVPPAYKLNIPHYLRVVRLIPLQPGDDKATGENGQPRSYRQRLAEDLLDPARTVTSALRLEALGEKSIPALKQGLESQHPLVRFCSAESLTYLGNPSGAKELGDTVEKQPFLRSYALAALASLDESVMRFTLQQLVDKGVAHETRYGAFRGLRALDPNYPFTKGEELNKAFWLHCLAPNTEPLVHVCTLKRSEIVLFGTEPRFQPPFAFESNGYTLTAGEHDDHCVVTYVPNRGEPIQRPCSFEIKAVLHVLTQLGATYPEVVDMLIEAGNCKRLNCSLALNALPQVPSAEEIAAAGRAGSTELDLSGQDLGETPTLYERPVAPPPSRSHGAGANAQPSKPAEAPAVSGGTE
jgi:Flagellar P-ring protein